MSYNCSQWNVTDRQRCFFRGYSCDTDIPWVVTSGIELRYRGRVLMGKPDGIKEHSYYGGEGGGAIHACVNYLFLSLRHTYTNFYHVISQMCDNTLHNRKC